MSLNTSLSQQHRKSRRHHWKSVRHRDHLASLSPRAILLLRSLGTELVAADGRQVEAFHLRDAGAHAECHPLWHLELPAPAFALADSGLGPLVAWNEPGRTGLGLVRAGHLSEL